MSSIYIPWSAVSLLPFQLSCAGIDSLEVVLPPCSGTLVYLWVLLRGTCTGRELNIGLGMRIVSLNSTCAIADIPVILSRPIAMNQATLRVGQLTSRQRASVLGSATMLECLRDW